MTFDAIKATTQRSEFTIVELFLDKNDPVLDDTFALQPDSFGTPKTTDNPLAYTGVDFRVFRYSDQKMFGVDTLPYLTRAKSTPPKLDPGKSIGNRATASITLTDGITKDNEQLPAPYDDRRVEGSHFLKLFARNHLKNRKARIIRGYNPFDYNETNTQIENYVIDSFTPPNENGQVTINLIDQLILTEEVKAKAPLVSSGELTLLINDATLTITFSSPITDEYGAVSSTGFIAVEKEIIAYTVASSTTLDPITRAQFGTVKSDHAVGETLQKCLVFEDSNIVDIMTTLITDFTKIPPSYIPTTDWTALKNGDLANYNLTRAIFSPKDVKKLLNELVQLAGLSFYADVIEEELVIVSFPDFANPVITFDENEHIIPGSIKTRNEDKKQITRQAIFWNKLNATETDNDKNYTKKFQVIDGVVEGPADISTVSESKLVKSNWLTNTAEDNQLATSFAQRNVSRFGIIPVSASFSVDQAYIGNVAGGRMWLGSIFAITTSRIVDAALQPITTPMQCTQITPSGDSQWNVTGLSYVSAVPANVDLFITEDQVDLLLTDLLTTTEAREYVVVITTGVTISASLTSIIAFTQGVFFAGATLSLFILGRVVGAAGDGGGGGTSSPDDITCALGNPTSGLDGGDAMSFSTDATIDNGFGFIGGGGGGGAGFFGSCTPDEPPLVISQGGDGGGGGQGKIGGTGGAFGTGTTRNGQPGVNGTVAAPGSNGGEFGADGGDNSPATGGTAGNAINKNGNTITITAGNNSLQIKGDVI